MLYYKSGKSKRDSYALNFDGVNDFLQPQQNNGIPLSDFNQLTFFFVLKPSVLTGNRAIFSPDTAGGSPVNFFELRNGQFFTTSAPRNPTFVGYATLSTENYNIISVTKDFIANEEKMYFNGVLFGQNITGPNPTKAPIYFVGRNTARVNYAGIMKEISVYKGIKTASEVLLDFQAGTQLGDDSDFVFRLPLIYPATNFNSLDSTVPILETSQNLDMNFFGYPNPLVKGINLIKI